MERWTDQWLEIHYEQSQRQIGRLAVEKEYRRFEWWQEFNEKMEQKPETD